jgi:hypothetical protein
MSSAEDVIGARTGMKQAGVIIRALKREGWAIVPSADHLAFKRAAVRLEKIEAKAASSNGAGTKTGRMSAKKPNLSQAPKSTAQRKADYKASQAKTKTVAPKTTRAKAATKTTAPRRAPVVPLSNAERVVLPPQRTPEQEQALAVHKAATPKRSVPRKAPAPKSTRRR